MPDFSKKQIGVIALPIVLIVILLPVALWIAFSDEGERNETNKPDEDVNVAGEQAPLPNAQSAIRMQNLAFVPDEIIVDVGSTLVFSNDDNSTHTATVDDGDAFDSGDLAPGARSEWTPEEPGTYSLKCRIHPNLMTGTITVRP
ncbi:MAG: cupredoxin domain-containing protein [Hyphomicrobiales bacterium]